MGDPARLMQIVWNLIHNAAKFTPPNGKLTIRTLNLPDPEHAGDGHLPLIAVELEDTGIGIDPAVLPRIFEAFSTTKPAGEGTGLGLWVSHTIIEHQRGTLRVENRPGGGARFVIELPAAPPDA